jgi:hypothetical protein
VFDIGRCMSVFRTGTTFVLNFMPALINIQYIHLSVLCFWRYVLVSLSRIIPALQHFYFGHCLREHVAAKDLGFVTGNRFRHLWRFKRQTSKQINQLVFSVTTLGQSHGGTPKNETEGWICLRCRDSSVCIVSDYELDDRAIGVPSPAKARGFFL